MPKKPTVKVAAKSTKPAPAKVAAIKPPEPSKRVVFELYECLTKLNVARELVDGIGIFPGDKAESLSLQVKALHQSIRSVADIYRKEWFEMKGEVGE